MICWHSLKPFWLKWMVSREPKDSRRRVPVDSD